MLAGVLLGVDLSGRRLQADVKKTTKMLKSFKPLNTLDMLVPFVQV